MEKSVKATAADQNALHQNKSNLLKYIQWMNHNQPDKLSLCKDTDKLFYLTF